MLVWGGRFAITENHEPESGVVIGELGGYDIREQRSTRGRRSGKTCGEWKHEDERKIMSRIV